MHRQIAMFNHKGGVSKTTTTFHLSREWAVEPCTVCFEEASCSAQRLNEKSHYRIPVWEDDEKCEIEGEL